MLALAAEDAKLAACLGLQGNGGNGGNGGGSGGGNGGGYAGALPGGALPGGALPGGALPGGAFGRRLFAGGLSDILGSSCEQVSSANIPTPDLRFTCGIDVKGRSAQQTCANFNGANTLSCVLGFSSCKENVQSTQRFPLKRLNMSLETTSTCLVYKQCSSCAKMGVASFLLLRRMPRHLRAKPLVLSCHVPCTN